MHIEDRWTRPTGAVDRRGRPVREQTERHGIGRRWLASWSDAGQRRSRSFDTKDAAVAYAAAVDVDQRAGIYVTPHGVTLATFGDRWVDSQIHQRDSTAEQMESRWRLHIRPVLGDMRLSDITRATVQGAVRQWSDGHDGRDGLAPSTVGVVYGYLTGIMKAARRDRLIRENPCDGINLPRTEHERVIPLTTGQVFEIADRVGLRYRGMILLGAATGMRSGELRGLTVDRLGWGELLIVRVDRQLVRTTPKWGRPKTAASDRSVTVDAKTAAILREHMVNFPPHESGLIFTGREGGPLARTSAATAWTSAVKGMGLRGRTGLHDLRHYHASLLIAAGLSVTAVAARLGHQDSRETLATYAHLWPNDESRSMQAIVSGMWSQQLDSKREHI